jgi:GNAT superfamily N-acetyltransferase
MEITFDKFTISDNKERLNRETILGFLEKSYWANERPVENTLKSIENSICVGVYDGARQVGYARIVTDGATVYYLCDVYIDEEYRGLGIGKKLVDAIVNREDLKGISGLLGTRDAHDLYKQYGFVEYPERFMRRAPQ